MKVQDYLRNGRQRSDYPPDFGGTLYSLKANLGISAVRHSHYPNLVLLKYSQINSPKDNPIVKECRGLILDEADNWNVVCRGFDRFFNYGEPGAAEIDWSTARVQEKVDGSLLLYYHYAGKWRVATKGFPDARGSVGDNPFTFEELFLDTLAGYTGDGFVGIPDEASDYCFLFELTSPQNRVVVYHDEACLTYLGCRNRVTGAWDDPPGFEMGGYVPMVAEFALDSFDGIVETFKHIDPLCQEGFVVVDGAGNRVKVKHPGYVAIHHLLDSASAKNFIDVIRRGEVPEVISYFPELAAQFECHSLRYNEFVAASDTAYERLKGIESQRDFAAKALGHHCSAVLFQIRSGKCADTKDFLAKATLPTVLRLLEIEDSEIVSSVTNN